MRAMALGPALLVLVACGGATAHEVHYDVHIATACIKQSNETLGIGTIGVTGERAGSFEMDFGEDLVGDLGYVLVVGYGSDRATALGRERQARNAMPRQIASLDHAWGRSDGNIVYEALGPVSVTGFEKRLPRGVSVSNVAHANARVSQRMRKALDDCLTKALR
jgi:hypothetical protein